MLRSSEELLPLNERHMKVCQVTTYLCRPSQEDSEAINFFHKDFVAFLRYLRYLRSVMLLLTIFYGDFPKLHPRCKKEREAG